MAVTMPKSPPPPRSAQNSSGSLRSVTRMCSPSGSTSSTARTWLAARPYFRPNQLNPPPRVYPTTDGSPELPGRPVSPVPDSAALRSLHRTPASMRAVRPATSTDNPRNAVVRSRIVPSTAVVAACPTGCAVTLIPYRFANRTAATMSSTPVTCTTASGRWSTCRSHPNRSTSHSGSAAVTIRPDTSRARAAVVSPGRV